MAPDLQSALRILIQGYSFYCSTVWKDDDSYRSMPDSTRDFFRKLIGREVSLDEFWIDTGGNFDGRTSMRRELVEEVMGRLTA